MAKTLKVNNWFSFQNQDFCEFDSFLRWFNWDLEGEEVIFDFWDCRKANYQSIALIVPYVWYLYRRGCHIYFDGPKSYRGGLAMLKNIGAYSGWYPVIRNQNDNFRSRQYKLLFAIRNANDYKEAMSRAESYIGYFGVDYQKTIRYVIMELLYNTVEHGFNSQIPSIFQFNYYEKRSEVGFVVADLGIGIRTHLSRAFPFLVSDQEAIGHSLKPGVSGTFVKDKLYQGNENAGMGLFISSNLIKRLDADMHIVSGNGHAHISPVDVSLKTLQSSWPGSFVYVTFKVGREPSEKYEAMLSQFRREAVEEITAKDENETKDIFHFIIYNFFGFNPEVKDEAVKQRDTRLFPAIQEGKKIILDFAKVDTSTHSFLNALLKPIIRELGLEAYRRISIVNASQDIRETLDFIFEDNLKDI